LVELSRKVALGGIALDISIDAWVAQAAHPDVIKVEPISSAIAIDAYQLPGEFHKDPADRLIVAAARCLNLTILTSDERILHYPHVRRIQSRCG